MPRPERDLRVASPGASSASSVFARRGLFFARGGARRGRAARSSSSARRLLRAAALACCGFATLLLFGMRPPPLYDVFDLYSADAGNARGFVEAKHCHPFFAPKHERVVVASPPTRTKRLSGMRAGYCLCADDARGTTIAGAKGCGSKPVACGVECARRPVRGTKPPRCARKKRTSCEISGPRGRDGRSYHPNVKRPSRSVVAFAASFADARGPPLGVKLPGPAKKPRRDPTRDFVVRGERLSARDVTRVKRRLEAFKRAAPSYPATTFKGRGIVVVGGNSRRLQTSYFVAAHAIRRTGCALPIQLWFPEGEMPSCERVAALAELRVDVVSFAAFKDAGVGGGVMTNRFMYKMVALTFSEFEEVLLLDSDNIVLADPSALFESKLYRSTGSLLWKDFWRGSSAPDCQVVLGNETDVKHTHESAQVVMKKSKTWRALMVSMFMNANSGFFYGLTVNYMGIGDKELFAMAFLHLGTPYGLVSHGPDSVGIRDHMHAEVLGNSMLQHAPDGSPMFLHANLGKPTVHVPESEETYVRRWQRSMKHGDNVSAVISDAAGVDDFEVGWYYRLLRANRCLFDDRPPARWHESIAFGPVLQGFHNTMHYGVNTDLEAYKAMVDDRYAFS